VPELGSAVAIGTGRQEICALDADGAVRCMAGLHGLEAPTLRTIALPDPATEIALGTERSCAIHGAGQVSCWWSGVGQRGRDPVALPFSEPVRALAVDDIVCGLLEGGSTECSEWPQRPGMPPARVAVPDVTDVAVHRNTVCVAARDQGVRCLRWSVDRFIPEGGPTRLAADSCMINAQGRPSCGQTTQAGGLTLQALSTAPGYTCGIDTEGSVRCWGNNNLGQLGGGDGELRAAAVSVGGTL
jgi:hypothetical protein